VYYAGVDLAWGDRGTTGLAVLDEDGRLRDVTAARSDQDILAWLRRWTAGSCLVAVDAPLIVTNPSGRRVCEALVGRYFGRFHAGCHPSSTARPGFADGGRAHRIARAAGLDVDPASTASRRAIEVYPHPATVVLFDLPAVLRYKAKAGRDLGLLRAEMLRLVGFLERLAGADVPLQVDASPRWQAIRHAVEHASRKSHLRAVEDSIDAVACAYIAAYADRAPDQVRVLGNARDGYIVTPVTAALAEEIDTG
jgi:predicted RNase H-like nuclease